MHPDILTYHSGKEECTVIVVGRCGAMRHRERVLGNKRSADWKTMAARGTLIGNRMLTTTLGDILQSRIQNPSALAATIGARVVFDPGNGDVWTLILQHGKLAVRPGADRKPDTTIFSDPLTLARVIAGEMSGIVAFLEGRLSIRGNLALALKLDSVFESPARPPRFPKVDFVNAGGIRTFYLEAGEGPPVILLHGLGATNASMLPTFHALADRYRVIAPDIVGFGETDKPQGAYHPAFFAHWAHDFMDALGVEKAIFIGNSMGGRISLEMAIRYPRRVEKLVLLTPSLAWHRFRRTAVLVKLLLPELAFVPILVPRARVMGGLKMMFSKPQRLRQSWHEAAVDEFLRVFKKPMGRIAFFAAARQIMLEDPRGERGFWERLHKVNHEALFIWGDRDRLVPAKFAAHVERVLPHAHSVVFADCGHVPQFELPDKTHQVLGRFLAGAPL